MESFTEMTGITGMQIKNTVMLLFIGCIMLGIGESYVTIAVGIAYPCFMSFLALNTDESEDDKYWLTYWTVFGAFNILDHFAEVITVFIPFYLFFKVLFLIYLMHPTTEGSKMIYENFILPNMEKYETRILQAEKKVAEVASRAQDLAEDGLEKLGEVYEEAQKKYE